MGQQQSNKNHHSIKSRDSGNRDAATVLVYLSGLGEGGDVFKGLVLNKLLAGFRHIVLDYVDWTKSTPPGEAISLEAVADIIADWLVAHGLRLVVLVGHSMGGVIGQLVAERHPELVAKLVNIEGNISKHDCTFSRIAVNQGFTALKDKLMSEPDPQTRRYADGLRKCDPATYCAYAEPLVRISDEETLAARLAALPMPVLYVHGQTERGLSKRSREMLSRTSVQVEPIGHAGHWPYLEEPEQFVRVLMEFIER